jgi:hypothetical protein
VGLGRRVPELPLPGLEDSERAYHGANLDRLRRVKATYDPDNVLRFDQSVQPTQRAWGQGRWPRSPRREKRTDELIGGTTYFDFD